MTAADFAAFLTRMGWTQTHAAKRLGVRHQPRISEWATGKRPIPPYISAHVETILRCEPPADE